MGELRSLQSAGARVWIMSPYPIYQGEKLKIYWDTLLPPNIGTRHQREYLLGSARQFLTAWIKTREQQKERLSPMTITKFYTRLRTLVRWMVGKGIWRFRKISEDDIQEYLKEIADKKVVLRGQKFSSISRRHIESSIFLLQTLWSLRTEYYSSLNVDISTLDIEPILALTRSNVRWSPVDIEISVIVIKRALEWCEVWGEINALHREMEARYPKWVGEPIWRRRRKYWRLFREMVDDGRLTGVSELRSRENAAMFAGRVSLDALVDQLIKRGIVLAPCDWGYCVYAPDVSKCHGSSAAPSEERRSPAICASCSNFAVSDRHIIWWSERYRDQEEFLKRDDLIPQARRVTEWRLKNTQYILGSIVSSKVRSDDA